MPEFSPLLGRSKVRAVSTPKCNRGGINGMAERAVDKGGEVKGLSPEAMRAQRTPLRPPALSTALSQAVYAGSQVKTILAWDFHISPEDTCPKAIVT